MTACPCNSHLDFDDCCGPILAGVRTADTAEALMRSRYSAHVKGNFEHVANTHGAEIQATYNIADAKAHSKNTTWLGLEITETVAGGPDDDTGSVTFMAHFEENNVRHVFRERSEFRRENGQWVYVDGKINPQIEQRTVDKIGRNDPCRCGSGKKYKKCCGAN